MATIEQLLGATAEEIASMNDLQLEDYLRDITLLEPPVKNSQIVGLEEEEKEVEDDNPIGRNKKKGKKKNKEDELLKLARELKELEEELK